MTTTILTDEQIESIAQQYTVTAPDGNVVTTGPWHFARAIEQTVLQSDRIRTMDGMAACMDMVRQELIQAGVITDKVPLMFVANAVIAQAQAMRKDAALGRIAMKFVDRAGDYCKEDPAERICDEFNKAMSDAIDAAMEKQP